MSSGQGAVTVFCSRKGIPRSDVVLTNLLLCCVHNLCCVHMQDSVVDQLHELIFEYLNIHAHTVGFPELALPILMEVGADFFL